ncbi:MAG: NAD-dependent epimerase/dehydratase family protein [bacterium]|nr:NAD-dependent epimerase/dehydratase family protein [bacterium]
MKRILITGSFGQIGSELSATLQQIYGTDHVVLTDIRTPSEHNRGAGTIIEYLDVTDGQSVSRVVDRYNIDTIYHMAAVLSGTGEKKPDLCWTVNMDGLKNVLDVARDKKLTRVFIPSSIAVFGACTPKNDTPQDTVLCPTSMYGVTKVSGEALGEYYVEKYGLDVRGIRYPGIISSEVIPSGGTTDYAVEIFYDAIKTGTYSCFLDSHTILPMMYLPDAIKGTIDLMRADLADLKHHTNFNMAAFSFSPAQLAAEIESHIPGFEVSYKPDFRQAIAETWPHSIDDSDARKEWGWEPDYNLAKMTEDMIRRLKEKLEP